MRVPKLPDVGGALREIVKAANGAEQTSEDIRTAIAWAREDARAAARAHERAMITFRAAIIVIGGVALALLWRELYKP
jgi:hypothetical protein